MVLVLAKGAPNTPKSGHLKTIGQRSGSSNRARSGRRHDRQQSNGPLAKHNREQSGPPCNRAIGSPAQSIPSVDHAGRPESCNEYDRALSGNCHNLVQSGSRPTSQGAHAEAGPLVKGRILVINRMLGDPTIGHLERSGAIRRSQESDRIVQLGLPGDRVGFPIWRNRANCQTGQCQIAARSAFLPDCSRHQSGNRCQTGQIAFE